MSDTPLPSELVEIWVERSREQLRRAESESAVAAGTLAFASMQLNVCARELQASLEAMQKGGGE